MSEPEEVSSPKTVSICEPDEHITIRIPKFIQFTINSFTPKKEKDISKNFNITIINHNGEHLYVDSEKVLRDVLKMYCVYKQLSERVEQERNELNKTGTVTIKNADEIIGTDDTLQGLLFREPPKPIPDGCLPECKGAKKEAPTKVDQISMTSDLDKECCECCRKCIKKCTIL